MPYKLKVERLSSQRRWYATNPTAKTKIVAARKRYTARNRAVLASLLAERCSCGLADRTHLEMRRVQADRLARRPTSVAKLVAFIEECPNRVRPPEDA